MGRRNILMARLLETEARYGDEQTKNLEDTYLADGMSSRLRVWTGPYSDGDQKLRTDEKYWESNFEHVIQPAFGSYQLLRKVEDVGFQGVDIAQAVSILHVRQQHSHSPLLITQSVLEAVRRKFNIFPRFKDMLVYMGRRNAEVEIAPIPPQVHLLKPPSDHVGTTQLEVCYGVRYVQEHGRKGEFSPWSLRQFVVYNQTDFVGLSTWVFVSLPDFLQEAFNEYHGEVRDDITRNPFDVHWILLSKAVSKYRSYLVYLSENIDERTRDLLACAGQEGEDNVIPPGGREQLKLIEDTVQEVLLALHATQETVTSLLELYYTSYRSNATPSDHGNSDQSDIARGMVETLSDIRHFISQAHQLKDKVHSTRRALSSYIESANGISLQNLAKEAREDSAKMGILTAKSARDSSAIMVLTVITLIYLPTTAVLNFLSTALISIRTEADGTEKVVVANNWWISVAASVPLTLLTLAVWWIWVQVLRGKGLQDIKASLRRRKVNCNTEEIIDLEKGHDCSI